MTWPLGVQPSLTELVKGEKEALVIILGFERMSIAYFEIVKIIWKVASKHNMTSRNQCQLLINSSSV